MAYQRHNSGKIGLQIYHTRI